MYLFQALLLPGFNSRCLSWEDAHRLFHDWHYYLHGDLVSSSLLFCHSIAMGDAALRSKACGLGSVKVSLKLGLLTIAAERMLTRWGLLRFLALLYSKA